MQRVLRRVGVASGQTDQPGVLPRAIRPAPLLTMRLSGMHGERRRASRALPSGRISNRP